MGFDIQYISGGETTYPGQIIAYKIKVLPGIRMNWVTEITQVKGIYSILSMSSALVHINYGITSITSRGQRTV